MKWKAMFLSNYWVHMFNVNYNACNIYIISLNIFSPITHNFGLILSGGYGCKELEFSVGSVWCINIRRGRGHQIHKISPTQGKKNYVLTVKSQWSLLIRVSLCSMSTEWFTQSQVFLFRINFLYVLFQKDTVLILKLKETLFLLYEINSSSFIAAFIEIN
jgi:hypothetical protein